MNFTIVDPVRTESGALAALVRELGEEEATPIPLPESAELTNFSVISDSMSVSAGARLGVGTIFNGAVSANEQGFYYDAMT